MALMFQKVESLASSTSSSSSLSLSSSKSCEGLGIDVDQLQRFILAGKVFQHHNFLNEEEIQILLTDIENLEKEGSFLPSGLSNTAKGSRQGFGQQDRLMASAPWWTGALEGKETEVGVVSQKLQLLRKMLAQVLDRPSMLDTKWEHECYYSKSMPGSALPRHMDERHEELKGSKGWLLPSRRSISWLVYLSDPGWDLELNGGALRSFYQPNKGPGVSHDGGNLQVGWLMDSESSIPVYLDSWFPVLDQDPHCVLYTVSVNNQRNYLTRPWVNEGLQGLSVADFLQACAKNDADPARKDQLLFTSPTIAMQFILLEDRPGWDAGKDPQGSAVTDIVPTRGSLVLFDSVSVPHQVEVIKEGTRVALAGWFHEETQSFPDNVYV
jgi:hypothetical protein